MNVQTIIVIVVVMVVIALIGARVNGPRVTQIDRTVERKATPDEDRDDA